MVRVSAAVAGVLCLLCSSAIAAAVNIDVGANAVNGEWRPTSCDQVKDGVVLSNIGDNIKAVIEGCDITVNTGTDTDLSAIKVSGSIGTSSSLELRRCTVSYAHTHATQQGEAINLAGFKAGSSFVLDNTTVVASAIGQCAAVYFPTLLGFGNYDAVSIIVRNGSKIFATSRDAGAFGIDFTGTAYGDNFTALVEDSAINVTGAQRAVGFAAPTTTFGAGAQVTLNNSRIQQYSADENHQTNAAVYFAGTAGAELKWTIVNTVIEGHGVQAVYWGPTLGARDSLVIDSSNISGTNTRSTSAFTHNKGRNVQIRRSVLSAEGALSVNAFLIRVDATAIDLTIDACTLSSNSPGTASVILSFGPLQSSSISIARSALVFYSGEKNTLYSPGGITLTWSAWTDVAMTLTHVSITALPGTTNDANLILWPELKGTSVQKLDHVSVSPPDDSVAMTIFSVARAAAAQSTLCRRMVTYGNGTDLPEALMPGLPAGENCVWPDSPATIDVSSKAVSNVWRPSCDEVKNGVVLTNFGDNIKAVIEGCDLYVNTWGNSELAAVHVDGAMGAQASLEFRDCNITLSHTATDDRVNTIVLPHIGAGGSFILDNTTVSVTCLGDAAAVYFRSVTCGANVSIIIRNGSELRAKSIADAGTGIDFGRMGSTFGDFATFLIEDSALNITGKSGGSGIASNHDTFGDNLTFTLKNSRIFIASSDSGDDSTAIEFVGTVGAHFRALIVNTVIEGQHAKALYWQPRVGPDDLFTVEESNFTALITDRGDAFYLRNAVNLRVLKSTIAVEGPAADTIALRIHSTAKQSMHIVVSESTLTAISQTTAVAFFAEIQLENSTIEFVDSSLEFRAGGRASYPPGGIAAIFHPWTDTTMTLINTKITALQGTVTNANATFITWPELRGASRQVLDRVIFAAPDGVVVEPYAIPAATPPSTSSLCSRGLVWANGTRFPAVPRFTVAPSCTWRNGPVTVDVSAKAVANVWRPSSCDEVKNGVALKNFGDNMQAIIEGCAIDLTAWDDSSLSAVSLAAPLGAHTSLILRQCTITASYTHPTAVSHAIKIGMINKGLSVILENTTVSVSSVADSIGVSVPVGILFVSPSQIENITLAVKNGSTIAVSSANESAIGMSLANTFFGNYFNVLVQDATVNATGERATCFSAPRSTFANNASVTIRSSRFSQAAVNPDDDAGAAVYFAGTVGSGFQWRMVDAVVKARGKQAMFWAPTLGSSDLLLIEASTIEAVNTGAAIAFAFEKGLNTQIRGSRISAESQESAVSFRIERATVIHLVVADGSTLVAKGPRTAASLLSMSVVASSSFQFLDSTLAFESTGRGAEQSGGIVAGLTWTDVSFSLENVTITALPGTTSPAAATFIFWPEVMGTSLHVLNRLTLSAPAGVTVTPFAVDSTAPTAQSTLCSRGLLWANGTRLDAPSFFTTAVSCTWPDAPITIDVASKAVANVWRPSCDEVKNGVVLSDFGDDIKAVIEGCVINVDAWDDVGLSAVAIVRAMGARSSLELRRCTITVSFTHPTQIGQALSLADFGEGSSFILNGTTMTTKGHADVAGVMLPRASCGVGTSLTVLRSSITATSTNARASGVLLGQTEFSHNASIMFDDSTITATGTNHAFGLQADRPQFGNYGRVTFKNSRVIQHSTVDDDGAAVLFRSSATGTDFEGSVSDSVLEARRSSALFWAVSGDDARLTVDSSNLTATNTDFLVAFVVSAAKNLRIRRSRVIAEGTMDSIALSFGSVAGSTQAVIEDSTLSAKSPTTAIAIWSTARFTNTAINITRSSLLFSAGGRGMNPSGSIICGPNPWTDTALAIFNTTITASSGTTTAALATFISWPPLAGASRQTLSRLTFSTPRNVVVTPFAVASAPSAESTLCSRGLLLADGAAVAAPSAFATPDACVWAQGPVPVNVSSKAVANVWRPSCDQVKNGVVLTNIGDNIKAVIEGCDITVNAGTDAFLAAIEVTESIGVNSSLELHGCSITVSHAHPTQATHAIKLGGFGNGSSFTLEDTTVTISSFAAAHAMFLPALTHGDDVSLTIRNRSKITVTSTAGSANAISFGSVTVGNNFTASVLDSTIEATGQEAAHGWFCEGRTFGHDASVTLNNSRVLAQSFNDDSGAGVYFSGTFGQRLRLSILDTSVEGRRSGGVVWSPRAGSESLLTIDSSNITATNVYDVSALQLTSEGQTVHVRRSNIFAETAGNCHAIIVPTAAKSIQLLLDESNVTAISTAKTAAAIFVSSPLTNSAFNISHSSLSFRSVDARPYPSGGIASTFHAWTDTPVTITRTTIAALSGTAAASQPTFIKWEGLQGASPQVLDHVTFSAPENVQVVPFAVRTTVSANSTFCGRSLTWGNGTDIAGPSNFVAPAAGCQWSGLVTIHAGANADSNGVWRPKSCDVVKDGVVLTGITDDIHAIIEGCSISLDAQENPNLSAVTVSGSIGARASLVLRHCVISSTHGAGGDSRYGVRLTNFKDGGSFILDNTSVTVSSPAAAGALLLPEGTSGDGVSFLIANGSSLSVVSTEARATGLRFDRATFGDSMKFSMVSSSVTTTGTSRVFGLDWVFPIFGRDLSIEISNCRFVSTTVTPQFSFSLHAELKIAGHRAMHQLAEAGAEATTGAAVSLTGKAGSNMRCTIRDTAVAATNSSALTWAVATAENGNDLLTIASSNITASSTQSVTAATLTGWRNVVISGSTIAAKTETGASAALQLGATTGASLAINQSTVEATSANSSAAALLSVAEVQNSVVAVSDSSLQFKSSAEGSFPSGGIVNARVGWSNVEMSISKTRIEALPGTTDAAKAGFVQLFNATGAAAKTFTNVAFAAPSTTTVPPFVSNMTDSSSEVRFFVSGSTFTNGTVVTAVTCSDVGHTCNGVAVASSSSSSSSTQAPASTSTSSSQSSAPTTSSSGSRSTGGVSPAPTAAPPATTSSRASSPPTASGSTSSEDSMSNNNGGGNAGQETSPSKSSSGLNSSEVALIVTFSVILAIVAVIAAGVLVYFLFFRSKNGAEDGGDGDNDQSSPSTSAADEKAKGVAAIEDSPGSAPEIITGTAADSNAPDHVAVAVPAESNEPFVSVAPDAVPEKKKKATTTTAPKKTRATSPAAKKAKKALPKKGSS